MDSPKNVFKSPSVIKKNAYYWIILACLLNTDHNYTDLFLDFQLYSINLYLNTYASTVPGYCYFIVFVFFIFLCNDNCFTEFWCFLSNLNMNQP